MPVIPTPEQQWQEIQGILGRVNAIEWGPWISVGATSAPAFENSWTNFASGWQVARFRRNATLVQITGLVKSGNNATTVFTLPPSFRPALHVRFIGYAADNGAADFTTRLDVGSDGAVSVSRNGTSTFTNPTGNASLNCVFGLG